MIIGEGISTDEKLLDICNVLHIIPDGFLL